MLIKDAVYHFIEVSFLCKQFLDHPHFQRLRNIKQLGVVPQVFPGATHTRFEHSLGVLHLAGQVVEQLRRVGVTISDREKDLAQLAGLYHDIGHLAYSHLFDEALHEHHMGETHEERSCLLVQHINAELNLLSPTEVTQVQDMIMGRHDLHPDQAFLYSIVCNKQNGIDVDKIAYLQQDAYRCRLPGFQHEYLIQGMSVGPDHHLQYALKTKDDVERLFETRRYMFRTVYRHRTVRRFEKLLLECLSHVVLGVKDDWNLARWIELDDVAILSIWRKELPELYRRFITRELPPISKEQHALWLEEHVMFLDQRFQLENVKFV